MFQLNLKKIPARNNTISTAPAALVQILNLQAKTGLNKARFCIVENHHLICELNLYLIKEIYINEYQLTKNKYLILFKPYSIQSFTMFF